MTHFDWLSGQSPRYSYHHNTKSTTSLLNFHSVERLKHRAAPNITSERIFNNVINIPQTSPSASTSTQRQRVSSSSHQHSGPAPPPRAPVSVHSTTTVSETATFHGTYPITIGSGTVIHPRAKLYSFEGPIQIGDGCIVGEKTVIGDNEPNASSATDGRDGILTRISSSVVIGPQATICTGAYIRSAAVVDSLAVINRNATIGSHTKICSSCEIAEEATVEDWVVIWAAGTGIGQRKRRRFIGPAAEEQGHSHRPNAKRIEDARLLVLHKEREGLAKMISLSATGGSKRR